MKKLMFIVAMVVMTGCAHRLGPDSANINGKHIYVGMSQQQLESLLGPPISSRRSSVVGAYNLEYGEYAIGISHGSVSVIHQNIK